MTSIWNDVSESDRQTVSCQLKSNDVSIASVIERCSYGFPRIILMEPHKPGSDTKGRSELDYRALSNLLWLTCPYINSEIHAIESQGYIREIENFISSDRAISTRMNDAHAHYYFLRKMVFSRFIGKMIPLDMEDIFSSGIGGTQDIRFIKCLHINYAHYKVCRKNVAGEIVHTLLAGNIECSTGKCQGCHNG